VHEPGEERAQRREEKPESVARRPRQPEREREERKPDRAASATTVFTVRPRKPRRNGNAYAMYAAPIPITTQPNTKSTLLIVPLRSSRRRDAIHLFDSHTTTRLRRRLGEASSTVSPG